MPPYSLNTYDALRAARSTGARPALHLISCPHAQSGNIAVCSWRDDRCRCNHLRYYPRGFAYASSVQVYRGDAAPADMSLGHLAGERSSCFVCAPDSRSSLQMEHMRGVVGTFLLGNAPPSSAICVARGGRAPFEHACSG